MTSRPPPHEQASASSSSRGPIASKAAAQAGSLQKRRALTIIHTRMGTYPDGMHKLTLLACFLAALVALALPAVAAAPSGWQQGTGVSGSFTVLRALSSSVAFAGGFDGALLRTDDGGATWAATTPPSSAGLRDIGSSDGTTIYTLDARGAVQRS